MEELEFSLQNSNIGVCSQTWYFTRNFVEVHYNLS